MPPQAEALLHFSLQWENRALRNFKRAAFCSFFASGTPFFGRKSSRFCSHIFILQFGAKVQPFCWHYGGISRPLNHIFHPAIWGQSSAVLQALWHHFEAIELLRFCAARGDFPVKKHPENFISTFFDLHFYPALRGRNSVVLLSLKQQFGGIRRFGLAPPEAAFP